MVDTIKIYAEINKQTYDKIYNNSIIKTSYNKKDGEMYYEIVNDHLKGTYDSRLSVRVGSGAKYRFSELGYYIEIEGSYHKLQLGYNSHNGFYDILQICLNLIQIVANEYEIKLPHIEKWYLQRVDIAICFDLKEQSNVRDYINNLSNCNYPRRNMKFYQDESVYLSGTTTTLKIYNKLLEFKKHDMKKFIKTDFDLIGYINEIKGFIRFECEIKKKKLKDFYHTESNIKLINVKYEDLKKIWECEFMRLLKFIDSDLKVVKTREEVYKRLITVFKPVRARNLYNFYVAIKFDGISTIKNRVSESTYYRNISDLKKCNIDLSQKYEIQEYNNIIDFNPFEYKEVV